MQQPGIAEAGRSKDRPSACEIATTAEEPSCLMLMI
jgi:hypothetical protein